MLPLSPRCRHYTGRCVLPSVRLLAAVTVLLLQLPHHVGGGLVTVDPALAGGRHVTKRGPGPRWLIVLLMNSPTILYFDSGIFTSVSTITSQVTWDCERRIL